MVTRGKNVFAKQLVQSRALGQSATNGIPKVNDLLLHAMFARIALGDDSTVEFETHYDKKSNTVELIVPEKTMRVFDQMLGMKRGPKMQKYIDWLMGSKRFEPIAQPNFISATAFDVFIGATTAVLNERMVLIFPGVDPSIIGYNLKLQTLKPAIPLESDNPCCKIVTPEPIQKLRIFLVWQFICGNGSNLELRISANILSPSQAPFTVINDVIISTAGVAVGDVMETEILDLDNLTSDTIISLTIMRNFQGSGDPHSEMIGMIGVRLDNV